VKLSPPLTAVRLGPLWAQWTIFLRSNIPPCRALFTLSGYDKDIFSSISDSFFACLPQLTFVCEGIIPEGLWHQHPVLAPSLACARGAGHCDRFERRGGNRKTHHWVAFIPSPLCTHYHPCPLPTHPVQVLPCICRTTPTRATKKSRGACSSTKQRSALYMRSMLLYSTLGKENWSSPDLSTTVFILYYYSFCFSFFNYCPIPYLLLLQSLCTTL
jgi:hypothetical protein